MLELQISEVERARVSSELEVQRAYFSQLFSNSPEAIVLLDNTDRVVDANAAFEELFQYSLSEIHGRDLNDLIVPEDRVEEARELSERVLLRTPVDHETVRRRKDGTLVDVSLLGCPIELDSERLGVFGIYRDFSVRKEHERHLEYLARYDPLTGLPNRFLFEDRLRQMLAKARRTGERIAVHFLDLDNFKAINDTMGHRAGDQLLQAAAGRLRETVRESDSVARLGGDEFGVLQTGISDAVGATILARKIVDAFSEPVRINGRRVPTAVTVGISLSSPEAGAEQMMAEADTALYKGKTAGRNRFEFHNRAMADEVCEYASIHRELHRALEREEFFLEYQPQVDLASGAVVGCEALVRWRHPERGVLGPDSFIKICERSGLIGPLGEWVLEEACRQRKRWSDAGVPDFPIAVNLAAAQFRDPRLAEKVVDALDRSGLPPSLLHLELTESTLLEPSDALEQALEILNRKGIKFCIDDFGTGYSSLRYLRSFPFHKVKIAREFVSGILDSSDDAVIVDAVAGLGVKLGLVVLAEGVEDGRQLDFLARCGCTEVQGYHFSPPVAADDIVGLIRAWTGNPVSRAV